MWRADPTPARSPDLEYGVTASQPETEPFLTSPGNPQKDATSLDAPVSPREATVHADNDDDPEPENAALLFPETKKDEPHKKSKVEIFKFELDTVLSEGEKPQVRGSVILAVVDVFLVITVVLANIVGFWRGMFGLIILYSPVYQYYFIFVLGGLLHLQFAMTRDAYHRYFQKRTIRQLFLRILYTYVFGLACIFQWAGLWYLLDVYVTGVSAIFYSVCGSLMILVGCRVLRNVLAPPFVVAVDIPDYMFKFKTMFRKHTPTVDSGTAETSLYVLDCFFSVFVIGSLVVFVWRGIWSLTDIFLYPEDETLSALGSLVIGYSIVIFVFTLQSPMKRLCEKLQGLWLLVAVDIYIFLSFMGTINIWRGFWNLINIYFLPETQLVSCWITHIGCFILLVLISCSNSILVRGVYIDGEEEGGKCVVFPTYYLRMFFQEKRKKKIMKQQKSQRIQSLHKAEEMEKSDKFSKEISIISCNHFDGIKGHVTMDFPSQVTRH